MAKKKTNKLPGTDIDILSGLVPLLVPIGDVKPDPANPRTTKDLESLKDSIRRFGIRKPIVVNERDGMSFGVGDEEGYLYSATCREATEEESAPLRTRLDAESKRREAALRLKEIQDSIRNDGECPDGQHSPDGDVMFDTFTNCQYPSRTGVYEVRFADPPSMREWRRVEVVEEDGIFGVRSVAGHIIPIVHYRGGEWREAQENSND